MFSALDAAHQHRAVQCISACLVLIGAACHGSPHAASTFFESEPNNDFLNANPLGAVFPGERLFIRGAISAHYPDPADGFAFLAAVDCDVELVLRADPHGADLDLHVYDPVRDEFVFSFHGPFDPEHGAFGVLGPNTQFHVVVTSASIASAYELEFRCLPPSFAAARGAGPFVALPRPSLHPAEPPLRLPAQLDDYRLRPAREDQTPFRRLPLGFWVEIDATGQVRSGPLIQRRGELLVRE
jgi:hypothetical protein